MKIIVIKKIAKRRINPHIKAGSLETICAVLDEYNGIPIKEIASYAFQYNLKIENLYLSDNIIKIGEYAFECCNNINKITKS